MKCCFTAGVAGWLKAVEAIPRKEPHLTFDLTEEFRALVVDSLVMALVNQKGPRMRFNWLNGLDSSPFGTLALSYRQSHSFVSVASIQRHQAVDDHHR
ncbi:MAG: CRISPR-associated endonuclease Cas1 [Synechococcales cyanobacterium C42_A2020_086]|nr:CRISPR-associated endonuclease Cas1 [Synechococcales cyanobacterium C42_A2020_086]